MGTSKTVERFNICEIKKEISDYCLSSGIQLLRLNYEDSVESIKQKNHKYYLSVTTVIPKW